MTAAQLVRDLLSLAVAGGLVDRRRKPSRHNDPQCRTDDELGACVDLLTQYLHDEQEWSETWTLTTAEEGVDVATH